jgi:hypothetical protein
LWECQPTRVKARSAQGALTRLNWRALSLGDDRLFEAVKVLKYRAPLRPQTDIFTVEPALWFRYSLHQSASQTVFIFDLIRIISPFLHRFQFTIFLTSDKLEASSDSSVGRPKWKTYMQYWRQFVFYLLVEFPWPKSGNKYTSLAQS